jgi:hypothetical protein
MPYDWNHMDQVGLVTVIRAYFVIVPEWISSTVRAATTERKQDAGDALLH